MPLTLFRSRAFAGANLMTLFLYGALAGMLFLLPFALIGRQGMSAREVGLVLLPLGLIIGLFARRAGALGRPGRRAADAGGRLGCWSALAGALLALQPPGLAGVLVPVVTLAGGMALVVAPLTTAVMNAAPGCAGRCRLRGQQRRQPAGRAVRGGAGGGGRGAGLRRRHRRPGRPLRGIPAAGAAGAAAVTAAFDRAYRGGMLLLCAAGRARRAWSPGSPSAEPPSDFSPASS